MNEERAGSVHGRHLIVADVEAARTERGVDVSEVFHFEEGGRTPGPDPERRSRWRVSHSIWACWRRL